jgi:hypothetical protein
VAVVATGCRDRPVVMTTAEQKTCHLSSNVLTWTVYSTTPGRGSVMVCAPVQGSVMVCAPAQVRVTCCCHVNATCLCCSLLATRFLAVKNALHNAYHTPWQPCLSVPSCFSWPCLNGCMPVSRPPVFFFFVWISLGRTCSNHHLDISLRAPLIFEFVRWNFASCLVFY